MRPFGRLLLFPLVLAVLLAGTLVAVGTTAATARSLYPAGVTGGTVDEDGRLSDPDLASCDQARPVQQYITFPSYAQTAEQICGIWSLENAAASAYNEMHGYAEGTPALPSGLYQQAGYVQTFLQQLAYATAKGKTDDVTFDQTAAYRWFLAVQQKYAQTVAADALREYQEWTVDLCHYKPPNTTLFTYNASSQPVCSPDDNGSLESLFTTVAPPTYANFVEYGRYDAEKELGLTAQASQQVDQTLIDTGIVAGAGALASVVAGGAPQLAVALGAGSQALVDMLGSVAPFSSAYLNATITSTQTVSEVVGLLNQVGEAAELVALGEEVAPELAAVTETVVDTVAEEAGVAALAEGAEVGANTFAGPFAIVTIAVTIAVMQGINVFTAANIPHQLADDAGAADPANTDHLVLDMLTDHGGAQAPAVFANFRSQLQFPTETVGVATAPAPPTPPTTGTPTVPTPEECPECVVYDEIPVSADNVPSRLHLTALNPNGTPSGWSTTASTATFIDTWGLGAANGAAGVPVVSVGIAGGRVWTKRESSSPPTDQSEAGLTGWLPSGELRYFNPAGQPMIAYLQGDKFVTQTSPGSPDSAGHDAGDGCASPDECTSSSSIVVMGGGGTPQLRDEVTAGSFAMIPCSANTPGSHDCFTDTLKANGRLVPANGSTITASDGETIHQNGTSHLYRLTILPDVGTPAAVAVTNSYNTWANNKANGVAPNGGLVAGDTATFVGMENSAAGYDTTYKWQVQTVCPADPAHPAQTIQGVTVCSDSPDYGKNQLAEDEQDLSTCVGTVASICSPTAVFGVTWTPDPMFHGGPVTTMTGRAVDFTWKAPGTYHLRLTTKDQYGVTRTSDRDLVVSAASAPRSSLSYASAADPQPQSIAPSVIGPVKNGTAFTVAGCVVSPTTVGATSYVRHGP